MLGNSARQCGGSTCEGRGSHRLTWSGMLENERSSAQLIFNKNNNNIKNKSNGKNNNISMSITMSLLLFFLWYSALFTDEIYGVHPLNLELYISRVWWFIWWINSQLELLVGTGHVLIVRIWPVPTRTQFYYYGSVRYIVMPISLSLVTQGLHCNRPNWSLN